MKRNRVTRGFVLLLVLLAALLPQGCGTSTPREPLPEVVFFSCHSAPYQGKSSDRLDLMADVANPTAFPLEGTFLEISLAGGGLVTLEFGDIPPRGEGTAWKPMHLRSSVTAKTFFGAPAVVVAGEGSLPETWFLTQVAVATLGYQRGGRKVERVVTEDINQGLGGWVREEQAAVSNWRSRAAKSRGQREGGLSRHEVTGQEADSSQPGEKP
jgi:hypothetical protein